MNRVLSNVLKNVMFTATFAVLIMILPLTSYADGKVTVTVDGGVNIRANASASGNPVGSAMKNETLEVISTETDSSGYTWYKVRVNANTVGYVRGDLVTAEGVPAASTAAPAKSIFFCIIIHWSS